MTENRAEYRKAAPDAYMAMLALGAAVQHGRLEHSLIELVKMCVLQINGCAYCLGMHSKDARAAGESGQRLHLPAAWREAPFYTGRERAALDWAASVTLAAIGGVPDALYQEVRAQFDERSIVELTLAIIAINGWRPGRRFSPRGRPLRGATGLSRYRILSAMRREFGGRHVSRK